MKVLLTLSKHLSKIHKRKYYIVKHMRLLKVLCATLLPGIKKQNKLTQWLQKSRPVSPENKAP